MDKVIVKKELRKKLENIKLVITDVDGVLTDGGMYYSETGKIQKKFNTKDGMAVELLKENGIEVALGEIVHTALFRYLITLKLKDNEDNGDDPIVNITFTWADSLNVHEMSASTDLTMSEIEEYVTIGTFEEVM